MSEDSDDQSTDSIEFYPTDIDCETTFEGPLGPHELMDHCTKNRNVESVKLARVRFHSDSSSATSITQHANTNVITLERFFAERITFADRLAALMFVNVVSHLRVHKVMLGRLIFLFDHSDDFRSLIVSNLLHSFPKCIELTMGPSENRETIRVALETTQECLEWLAFTIYEEDDIVLLAQRISKMFKLKYLKIHFSGLSYIPPPIKRYFFQTVDACTAPTQIEDNDHDCLIFSQKERQLLMHGRKNRNRDLRRFVECPTGSTHKELLVLMLKLEHCPTGLYEFARALPACFYVSNE